MTGYFKVSMDAAKALSRESDGPELLAGYITLCGYAFEEKRVITAAGAQSIRKTIGCTDFRSKRIMDDLRALRYGERGEHGFLQVTDRMVGNAAVYRLLPWDGADAYLPSLLIERHPVHGSALKELLSSELYGQETLRDALLLLLHVYSCVDYAEWFGCPPDRMAYQEWRKDGTWEDLELGHQGNVDNLPLWLVGQTDNWTAPRPIFCALYGADAEQATKRFWTALWCLNASGLIVPVVSVQTARRAYPLWVYSKAYRETLRELKVVPDLGKEAQLAACDSGLDPDNYLVRYAIDEMERTGTGLFYCLGSNPTVRTVIVPRLHAPTPMNMDGIKEAANITRAVWRQIRAARRTERIAA